MVTYSDFDTDAPETADRLTGTTGRRSRTYVRWLQQALNSVLGTRLAPDGIMGPRTRKAVRTLQQRAGITVDGIPGPQTERALIAMGATPPRTVSPGASVTPMPAGSGPRLVPVERPGGGRIQNKSAPAAADLTTVPGVGGRRIQLHRHAAAAHRAMLGRARAAGLRSPLLLPTSGFRSPATQARLWKRALAKYGSPREARKWVAPPGGSAHQSGRAIDYHLGGSNSSANVARLRTLPAYRWLAANARTFGFYPYPREPWHWEYNPPAAS